MGKKEVIPMKTFFYKRNVRVSQKKAPISNDTGKIVRK
ncbi:hypothetical protein B4113_3694 [Geobacillus sp. B4113_201601]|nr:hypothetical protein B4113_3694 [Geobacillus sp. B4113_201601]